MTTNTATAVAVPRAGGRYERRRQAIIAAATDLLNKNGIKGMRLADVAARLGLTTTSVTYYYRRKEDLAVACLEAGYAAFAERTAEAAKAADPAERVGRFIRLHLSDHAQIRAGQRPPISYFNDVRSLSEPHFTRLIGAYLSMIENIAQLYEAPGYEWLGRRERLARAQLLLDTVLWSSAWLWRYSIDDYERIGDRMIDILLGGLAAPGGRWAPKTLALASRQDRVDLSGQELFLDAATRLINERGYRGASVKEISAFLNVTKGSFYHHNEAKDELVVECFKRSFAFMRQVQRQVRDLPGDEWLRLSTAAAALVEHQLSPRGPLLRTSALSALPLEIRAEMVERSGRVSDHFAAMISDGIAQGCMRPVDPYIASQIMNAMINAASDLVYLDPPMSRDDVAELYARPLLMGFFNR